MSPRTGRRPGSSGTREAILDSARQNFGDNGYDATSIRRVAQDAGVDPALVHHYFLNTMADATAYARRVDRPNFGVLYDTFHANIEERTRWAASMPRAT